MSDTAYASPTACRAIYDFANYLPGNIDDNSDSNQLNLKKSMARCVHLRVEIAGIISWALLDTGSQITCISEDYYKKLLANIRLTELPASNIHVATAIGKKATTIRKQVFLDFNMNGDKFTYSFLVVPYLSTEITLDTTGA